MWNIGFNLIVSEGLRNMFGIKKGDWKVIAAAVVVMLILMYALHNVRQLNGVASTLGLDD